MNNTPGTVPDSVSTVSVTSQIGTEITTVKSNVNTTIHGLPTIEIAGYTILAMPLELIPFTLEQQQKFEEVGGLINPSSEMAMAPENQEKMMYWTESFEEQIIEIKKKSYTGFDLWKKVFADFPEYASMTEEQATTAGLYPAIHYRNHVASKWTAEMHGGHLAELDENYEGELRDIYDATQGKTNLQKLASMGQAPLGGRCADDAEVYSLGLGAKLGSGLFDSDGDVRALDVHLDGADVGHGCFWQRDAVSSVVVMKTPEEGSLIPGPNNYLDSKTLPSEAIITLANGHRVISQRWLATQRPPESFQNVGGEVYDDKDLYSSEKCDPNKMQCWLKNGIWYWNEKGGQWLTREMSGKILSMASISRLCKENKGRDNIETMENMGISPSGYFNAYDGEVWYLENGSLRSDSRNGDGYMQIFYLYYLESAPQVACFWNEFGSVPFISLGTAV